MNAARTGLWSKHGIWPKSNSVYYIVTSVLIGALCYSVYETGPVVHTGYCVYDTILLLDGVLRAFQGQTQGIDFHSLQGPVFFNYIAFFLKFSPGPTTAVVYANIFMALVLSALAFVIFPSRTSCVTPILTAIFVSLLCLGPYTLGVDPQIGYAMLYNRYCYAMLFIIVVETAFPGNKNHYNDVFGALVIGALLVIILFIKYTYFFVGLAFVLYRLLFIKRSVKYLCGVAGGILAASLFVYLTCRFDLKQIIQDYAAPLSAITQSRMREAILIDKIKAHLQSIVIAAGMLVLYARGPVDSLYGKKIVNVFFVVALASSSIVLTLTNYGPTDMPLLVVLSIILLEFILNQGAREQPYPATLCAVVCCVSIVCVFAMNNLAAIVSARADKTFLSPGIAYVKENNLGTLLRTMAIDSPFIDDFYVHPKVGLPRIPCVPFLNDGIELARKHTTDNDSLGALFIANIFNIALGRKPPLRAHLFWDYGMTFSDSHFPDAASEFEAVNYVLVPKQGFPFSTTPMRAIYKDYFNDNFTPFHESTYWTLLKRNGVQ